MGLRIGLDAGGAFTDFLVVDEAGELPGMGVREVIRPGALTEDVLARVRRALGE